MADEKKLPPGVTISADGYYQNSNGEYVDASGNLSKEPVMAPKAQPPAPPAEPPPAKPK